jgi:hypothetical protein
MTKRRAGMTVKTVRLDAESERILNSLAREMGVPISAVLRQGLLALRDQRGPAASRAYDVFRELDLGPGGEALAPSTGTRRGMEQVLRRRRK